MSIGIIAGLFIVVAAIWFRPLVYQMLHNPFDAERFEQSKWKSAVTDRGGQNPRGPMAGDLRRRFLEKGMPKEAVRALLGEPDNSESDEVAGNIDRYFLGHWGSMSIDGDYLIIHYDQPGRVSSTEIYEH
ncbi:MAG: hypothetical protein HY320_15570 [Armatimonadetes bacterium]|nr:hypothetical protein [Armatimonadota bacterium]